MKRSDKSLPPHRVRELKRIAEKIDREEAEQIKATGRAVKARHDQLRDVTKLLNAERHHSSGRSESGGTEYDTPQRGDGL